MKIGEFCKNRAGFLRLKKSPRMNRGFGRSDFDDCTDQQNSGLMRNVTSLEGIFGLLDMFRDLSDRDI